MLTEILFEIYKLFSFTGIINKDFNDSLEKTKDFSLPFRLLPKSPRSLVWVVLTSVLCKNYTKNIIFIKINNVLVSALVQLIYLIETLLNFHVRSCGAMA